jgi:uncharacterized protein (DUF1697 family)
MPTYIALLRAVNVGGTGALSMDDLRKVVAGVGLTAARTILQSGNLVFVSRQSDEPGLERRLETAVAKTLGVETQFFVRGVPEWRQVVSENPFVEEAKGDPARLTVTALKVAPPPEAWEALSSAIRGMERLRGIGRHAYIVYPEGMGRSKVTIGLIERKLGTRGTTRNWNTVRKLETLAEAL